MLVQFQTFNTNFTARYSQISKQDLKACIDAGFTYKQMAEKFNVTAEFVGRAMRWYGLKSAKTTEREKNITAVTELAENGFLTKDIKQKTGLAPYIIRKILKKYAVSESKQTSDPVLTKVAEKLNLSDEELKKYLK